MTTKLDPATLTKEQKLALIWRHTHKDYKGNTPGLGKTVLVFRQGTCLAPLDQLTDDEVGGFMPLVLAKEEQRLVQIEAKGSAKAK